MPDLYEHVVVERRDNLIEIVINRPDAHNSIHPPLHEELTGIFDMFDADPSLWVAIITGAGHKAFSTGGDLKYMQSGGPPMVMGPTGLCGLTERVRTKPVIAAVNGYAIGGGMELCLACDLIVADETARFGLSEVKVGLCAGAGGPERLLRQLPKKVAMELLLTGRHMKAEEAHRYGMVNAITPAGQALEGARALASQILDAAPLSVQATMQMINDGDAHASENAAVAGRSRDILMRLVASADAREGMLAFAQKRPPVWANR